MGGPHCCSTSLCSSFSSGPYAQKNTVIIGIFCPVLPCCVAMIETRNASYVTGALHGFLTYTAFMTIALLVYCFFADYAAHTHKSLLPSDKMRSVIGQHFCLLTAHNSIRFLLAHIGTTTRHSCHRREGVCIDGASPQTVGHLAQQHSSLCTLSSTPLAWPSVMASGSGLTCRSSRSSRAMLAGSASAMTTTCHKHRATFRQGLPSRLCR